MRECLEQLISDGLDVDLRKELEGGEGNGVVVVGSEDGRVTILDDGEKIRATKWQQDARIHSSTSESHFSR